MMRRPDDLIAFKNHDVVCPRTRGTDDCRQRRQPENVEKPPAVHGETSAGDGNCAGERAARSVSIAAVKPLLRANSVSRTADHHSAGILSRCHHLLTAEDLAPMSAAMASLDAQISTTSWNDATMQTSLGHAVLKCKAKSSYDCGNLLGQNVLMADRMSETEEKLAFIGRVRAAREAQFGGQKPICVILGIPQDRYKHYEKRSPLPWSFIPKFCAATGVTMEWLLTGEGPGGPTVPDIPKQIPRRLGRIPKGKAA